MAQTQCVHGKTGARLSGPGGSARPVRIGGQVNVFCRTTVRVRLRFGISAASAGRFHESDGIGLPIGIITNSCYQLVQDAAWWHGLHQPRSIEPPTNLDGEET